MIECKNLSIGYNKKVIAKDLSFVAKSGEITVILGKNGCGKSTLLKSIVGILPFTGEILIDGESVKSLNASRLSKMISLMPQMLGSPSITVRELVAYGRHPYTGLYGRLSGADRNKVESTISELGIEHIADLKLDRISGGERQKAYFAMLMAQDTATIMLDEPNSHIDSEYSTNICNFLIAERQKGKTVIAVLHDINRAIDIADKIIVIDDEKIVFDGMSEDLTQSDIPSRVFGLTRYDGVASDGKTTCIFFK